jgi:putative hemolysin
MRPGDPRIALLTEVSGLKKLERFYNAIEDLQDLDFVAAVFKNLELEIEVDQEDLANVPKEGGLVFVSNHPYGAIDGLALVHVLGRVRPT